MAETMTKSVEKGTVQKIALGSDHAGLALKERIKAILEDLSTEHGTGHSTGHRIEFRDFGTYSDDACDYPDYARQVADHVSNGTFDLGILCCGSGIGVSIVANKVRGIRAALCHDETAATLSRQHNDANILCLAGRTTDPAKVEPIVRAWVATTFEGGRHKKRVDKIEKARAGSEWPL